ncbi:anthranilate synthase component I family protein [Gynurincola endophyticus]|jgi:anthranilate synthase component 1|uniref:anthranilate synthase component I family protein n=1 Tax=Gynurincola endophyticus TaxID=2479004 RepID=UPI000F8C3AE9|nr:anthranilate synthase component I family protein [Gynurincola endophyticus]
MKQIKVKTQCKKLLADVFTPVAIYLRVRDRFRDTVLLESSDNKGNENSFSFIAINAIGGIEITSQKQIEFKYPGEAPQLQSIATLQSVPELIHEYMQRYEITDTPVKEAAFAQGLYGYTGYDAIEFFDSVKLEKKPDQQADNYIPLMRYRLYQYVIAINHHKDEMFICENILRGVESELPLIESLIYSKDVPVFPFAVQAEETSNLTDEAFIANVKKGIEHCYKGDVFQIVLSRRFQQSFIGDEFNVYRALRSVNPSPYLFFFDYGDYKLLGSSPEAQIIINKRKAIVHPIAGTFKRTGDEETDAKEAQRLLEDAKENAEHVMLVDLARNDLSRLCEDVTVAKYKQVHYYSHVIHLVSEVTATVKEHTNPFDVLAKTFPAGTLSGAPKIKAMEIINHLESTNRSYYGGAIGFVGFNGDINHAIMIRTFLSKKNKLYYQAGAGVVAASNPESELQEVNNKLGALKKAIQFAAEISKY